MRRNITQEEVDRIKKAIQLFPLSMAEAAKHVGLSFGTFKYRAIKLGLYTPNQDMSKGVSAARQEYLKKRSADKIPTEDILTGKYPTYRTYVLKDRLIKEGIKEYRCEGCGNEGIHNGNPLTLELDHINGISNDHRLENLRLLCPNCHSQTPTFRRRLSSRNK